ncbi:hypothetical protein BJ878DRAFT_430347 [Calycina marina]|uniref:N-acetyltransferase domain-containing protein n=1 Tax=Calycina marina TaxID=1763456 RepID=A0A9P7YUV2_9HELO|nr:hypothetical protein BJ878DRAFT_430347 [Calycina marina]
MEKQVFEKYDGGQVTDSMLQEAAVLFSENYGVWGEHPAQMTGNFAKAGTRVRLSKDRLRAQYLYDNNTCSYVRVTVDGHLAGNAFACRWAVNNKSVCWVTQLVVDRNYRERGLAKSLLNQLKHDSINMYGLMSSHPAACLAAAKAFGDSLSTVRLDVIAKYAGEIMEASPIGYVKDAKLRGSIFSPGDTNGLVSCVDSGFFVDHTEPLEALAWVREGMDWPLGELLDGHEFLLVFEARSRSRSRSTGRQ